MTNLSLSSHAIAQGDRLTVTISDHPVLSDSTDIRITLFGVEEAETTFRTMTSLPATVVKEGLEATLDVSTINNVFVSGRMYEIAVIELFDSESKLLAYLHRDIDFPRTFFIFKANPDEPSLSSEEISQKALQVERRREENYSEPLGDPFAPDTKEFQILMFVERLLLTRLLLFPGLRVSPLIQSFEPVQKSAGLGGSDELEFINYVLRDMGWIDPQHGIDRSSWRDKSSHERPVVMIHAPRVFASNLSSALRLSHSARDRLLELLAFHRNASGRPFATAIRRVDPTTGQYDELRVYPEGERYKGNLIGGFISGEDQSVLLTDYKAMQSEPFLSFILYLHAEAQAEGSLDFAYFRYWNLLETIASERLQAAIPVTDFEGKQILTKDGAPFDTGGARGRVYELVKQGMQSHGHGEEFHQEARNLSLSLWEAVHVWYGFRNATAHHGGFNPNDPRQKKQSWYGVAVDAQQKGAQPSGYGHDPYFSYLKEVTSDVVEWELGAARGPQMTP